MKSLFNRILVEIISEVSIDQLKQQFVDSGKLPKQVFDKVVSSSDKSAYATWLVKMYLNGYIKEEDLYKWKEYLDIFTRHKSKYKFKDINQYKSLDDLKGFLSTTLDIKKSTEKDPSLEKGLGKEDKYKELLIGTVDGFNVYEIPEGREDLYNVSCDLGSGTEWCTATGNTDKFFKGYIKGDSLFIFINPKTKQKFQFHYASDQFMDANDQPIFDNPEKYTGLYNLFSFLENKKGRKIPFLVKLFLNRNKLTKDDLNVDGDIHITVSDIEITLPDNLTVNGDLIMDYTVLNKLPDNLTVIGYLDISNTMVESIPENLTIIGSFDITDTILDEKFTDIELRFEIEDKGGKIEGDIYR